MAWLTAISNFFSGVASVFGWAKQRDAEKNATDVKSGAIAASEQKQVDKSTKAVAQQNAAEIEKEIAK